MSVRSYAHESKSLPSRAYIKPQRFDAVEVNARMSEKRKKQSDYGLNALNTPLYGSKKTDRVIIFSDALRENL